MIFFFGLTQTNELAKAEKLNKDLTYIFELCCSANRVVTVYPDDRVYIIGARNKITGIAATYEEVSEMAKLFKVMRPKMIHFKDIKITSLNDAKDWIENEAVKTNEYGHNPEGFVVYYHGCPLCKIKNKKYLEKHGLIMGDLLFQRNIVIDRFFEENIDDVMDVLYDPLIRFLDEMKEKMKAMLEEVKEIRLKLANTTYPAKKEYVEFAKQLVPSKYLAFFLSSYDQVIDVNFDITTYFFQWLKRSNNYKKYNEYWKATKIPEIVNNQMKVNPDRLYEPDG